MTHYIGRVYPLPSTFDIFFLHESQCTNAKQNMAIIYLTINSITFVIANMVLVTAFWKFLIW